MMVLPVLMLVALALSESASAYGSFTYQNIKYEVINNIDKTVQVTGIGIDEEGGISIPELVYDWDGNEYLVVKVGNFAFLYNSNLTYVYLPSSITEIGWNAFMNCINLTGVYMEEGLTKIGHSAFKNCGMLQDALIPNSVTQIGDMAFQNCGMLQDVSIPNSLTEIGECTFQNCFELSGVGIPEGITKIGDSAFENCSSLFNAYLPSSLTEIGDSAFQNCGTLVEVDIPCNVTEIGERAFYGCDDLTSVYYNTDELREFPEPNIFSDVTYQKAILYLREDCIESASLYAPWKFFKKVEAIDPTIRLDKTSLTLIVDGEIKLTVIPKSPDKTYSYSWESSDNAVARVSDDGVVTGVKSGKATITVTATDVEGSKYTSF